MSAGVIEKELQKTVINETLFKPVSWQAKIDFINHLILHNNVLIAVLAEKKGGKTAFIRLLQENFDSKITACVHTAHIDFVKTHIIEQLVNELHLHQDGSAMLSLGSVIQQINARKNFVILIIDNAQDLPKSWLFEVLEELKKQKEPSYFRLCLVSDFSLVIHYNALVKQDNQNTIHCIELGTLNENETKTYLLHKNSSQNTIYRDEQLIHIYKMTGGCLAKINQHLSTNSLATSQSPLLSLKRSCITVLIAISVAGLSWKALMVKEPSEEVDSEKIAAVKLDKAEKIRLSSQMPNWQEGYREFNLSEIPPAAVAFVNANDLVNQISESRDSDTFIPSIHLANKTTASETIESFIVPINTKTEKYSNRANTDFSVQLLASHNINKIHDFIRQNELKGKCSIHLVKQKNDTWFILTLGNYQTSHEAKMALQNLPTNLTASQPWVRITNDLKLIG